MQGTQEGQASMLALVCTESHVSKSHPIRRIKAMADRDRRAILMPSGDESIRW